MFVRQVKRKCGVRGCKNTDCFAISRTREVGNTVIICKSCLGNSLASLDEINPKTKSNIPPLDNTPAPALFFNAAALGVVSAVDDSENEPEQTEETTPTEDTTEFKCDACGKTFDSEKGLKTHLRYCKPQTDNKGAETE